MLFKQFIFVGIPLQVAQMSEYNPARDVTPAFLHQVASWINGAGEVLIVLRYIGGAGAKNYALCRTHREFVSLISSVPVGTDIEVFRDRQLPIRGEVDEAFIESALRAIPDGAEYLWITIETEPGSRISRYGHIGSTHVELEESLIESTGSGVALGLCPDYNAPDGDGLVSAAKGGIDGPR